MLEMLRYEPLEMTKNTLEHNLRKIQSRTSPSFDDILDEHRLYNEWIVTRQLSSTRAVF
jgi:sugar diacid utilization regulator